MGRPDAHVPGRPLLVPRGLYSEYLQAQEWCCGRGHLRLYWKIRTSCILSPAVLPPSQQLSWVLEASWHTPHYSHTLGPWLWVSEDCQRQPRLGRRKRPNQISSLLLRGPNLAGRTRIFLPIPCSPLSRQGKFHMDLTKDQKSNDRPSNLLITSE